MFTKPVKIYVGFYECLLIEEIKADAMNVSWDPRLFQPMRAKHYKFDDSKDFFSVSPGYFILNGVDSPPKYFCKTQPGAPS